MSVEDICHRDVCLLSNTMELYGTWLVVLKAPKKTHLKKNVT